MSRTHVFNAQVTVIDLIIAETPDDALGSLTRRLQRAGFEPHIDIGKQDAFHSETCDCDDHA